MAEDEKGRIKAICKISDAYLLRAKNSDSSIARSVWVEKAIGKLIEAGNQQKKVEMLKKELVEEQSKIPDEMSMFSTGPIDLSEQSRLAILHVQGKDWPLAMLCFANVAALPSVDDLKSFSQSMAEKCVISFIGSGKYVDSRGRTVAKSISGFEDQEAALKEFMYQQASLSRHIDAAGRIEPARKTIISEHACLADDCASLLSGNPYVTAGHQLLIARGISAGMHGDFIVAYHFLVPQLEEILRIILIGRGVMPFNINIDSIQSDWSMGKSLEHPEIENELGKDIVWMLKCLLTEKLGVNGRNLMAHGLMKSTHFFTYDCVYFWWLFIHILFLPIYRALKQS
jgi:hypothetical protein